MVYQIGGGEDRWEDEVTSLRLFWQTSHGGRNIADFNEGYASGEDDFASSTNEYLSILYSVEVTKRDVTWEARRDGYLEAKRARTTRNNQ